MLAFDRRQEAPDLRDNVCVLTALWCAEVAPAERVKVHSGADKFLRPVNERNLALF
jgi:hypothetical protein